MEGSNLDRALRRGLFAAAPDHPEIVGARPLAQLCPQKRQLLAASFPLLKYVWCVLRYWMRQDSSYQLPRDIINYITFDCGIHRFFLHRQTETLRQERIWCMTQLDIAVEQPFLLRNLKQMIRFLQFRHEHTYPRMLRGTRMWLRFIPAYDELLEGAFLTRAP